MKDFNYNHDVIIQKSKDQILYTNLYIVSTFMFKGKVPYLTHLYIFTLSPQNNQAPFFLIYLPQRNPLSEDTNLVQYYETSHKIHDVFFQKNQVQILYINLYIVPFGMHFV